MKRSAQTRQLESKRSAFNALEHVTAEISNMLERGVMPWRAPWDHAKALALTPGLPLRSTGEPYRGANVMLLWAAQIARGYSKRTWLTFRQALELGGHVRKGEKACPIIYYGQAQPKHDNAGKSVTDDRGDAARSYRFLKLFYVFNVDQVDELPGGFGAEVAPVAVEPGAIEQWSARAGVLVRIGGSMACYAPATDLVHMPAPEAFLSEEHWAATLLHEICNVASVIGCDDGMKGRPIGRPFAFRNDATARRRTDPGTEGGASGKRARFATASPSFAGAAACGANRARPPLKRAPPPGLARRRRSTAHVDQRTREHLRSHHRSNHRCDRTRRGNQAHALASRRQRHLSSIKRRIEEVVSRHQHAGTLGFG